MPIIWPNRSGVVPGTVSNKNGLKSHAVGAFFDEKGIVFFTVLVVDMLENHPRGNVGIVLVLQYWNIQGLIYLEIVLILKIVDMITDYDELDQALAL